MPLVPGFSGTPGFLPPYRIFTKLRQGNGLPPFAHSGFRPCQDFRNAPEAPALSAHAAGKRRNAAPAQPLPEKPPPLKKKQHSADTFAGKPRLCRPGHGMAASQGKTPHPACRTASPALFCEGKTAFSCRWFPAFPARRGFLPPYRIFTSLRQGNGLSPSHIPASGHAGASGTHRNPRRFPPMPPVSAETPLLYSLCRKSPPPLKKKQHSADTFAGKPRLCRPGHGMAASQGKTPHPACRTASPALFCEGKTAFSCRWFPAFPARRGFLPPYRIFTNLRQGNGLPPFAHSGFRPCRGFRNAPESPALSAHAAGKRRNAAPAQPCRKVPAPSLKKTKRRKRPCRKSLAEHARILLPLRQVPFRRISVFSSITLMIAVSGSGAAGLRDRARFHAAASGPVCPPVCLFFCRRAFPENF